MIHEKTFITLEYDKILSILKQHLACEVGTEFAEKLRPASDIKEAETLQEQTDEAEAIYSRTGRTPISGFPHPPPAELPSLRGKRAWPPQPPAVLAR